MVFLIAVDPICHTYWHYYRPQNFKSAINPDDAKRLGRLIPAMYEHNDQYISKLQPHIDQDTVVIIVSDHGFHGTGQIPKPSSVINYKKMGIDHVEKLDKSVMTGMSGWHDINGVFIASGGPILPGAKPKTQPSLLDITPTILALMGLPVARDMPGRVLKELIDPKFFAKHPVKYIDSYEGIIKRHQPSDSEATGENAQLEYLRSLGYVK
jgi:predicted AlkP superfamily phosphohydrolase/phosphomutase